MPLRVCDPGVRQVTTTNCTSPVPYFVQVVADDAKADLEEAMPALNAAIDSLKALNKNDITEIKSFPKPPPLVQVGAGSAIAFHVAWCGGVLLDMRSRRSIKAPYGPSKVRISYPQGLKPINASCPP